MSLTILLTICLFHCQLRETSTSDIPHHLPFPALTHHPRWNGHYYWGMNINSLLGSPRGTLNLQGSSRVVTYNFKLVREGPKGRTTTPLPVELNVADNTSGDETPAGVVALWSRATLTSDVVQDVVPGVSADDSA